MKLPYEKPFPLTKGRLSGNWLFICNQPRCKSAIEIFQRSCGSCVSILFEHYLAKLFTTAQYNESHYLILADYILIRSLYLFRFDTRAPLAHSACACMMPAYVCLVLSDVIDDTSESLRVFTNLQQRIGVL